MAADLAAATHEAARAAEKDRDADQLSGLAREDREIAIGKHLHDSVSALERAIERLVQDLDGDLPRGRAFHQDLLDRAARDLPGTRPALLTRDTRRDLGVLVGFRHAFRHAYGAYDFARARPNVRLAASAIPRAAAEIHAVAKQLGIAPG